MRRLARIAVAVVVVAVLAAVTVAIAFWRAPLWFVERGERRALVAAGLERATLAAPHGELVYFAGGSGSAVVLVHGANDQAGAWSRVVPPLLAAGYRVVVPDLPGHGESGPASGPLGAEVLREDLATLVAAAAAKSGPVALVGNSMGGWLALLEARTHPQAVRTVVLVNGAALTTTVPDGLTLLPRTRAEGRHTLQVLFGPHAPYVPNFVVDHLVRRSAGSPLTRMQIPPPAEHLLEGRLGEIAQPVTLLHGADDGLMPPAYAERVAAALPRARLEILADCGHVPQRLCPEALAPRLVAALADGGRP